MAQDSIKISIELADAAAQKALSNFISKGEQADKGMKKVQESGSSAFNEIGIHIGKATGIYDIFAGNLMANLVTKAFDTMVQAASFLFETLVVDGVKSAQESEDALNSLNVALGQAGIFSKETSKFFQDLGNKIQDVTTLDDDMVIKNAALIESMTHLSKDGLSRATEAAIQLSAAFNIDLETASTNVAKATNGNTTALHKLGLGFETTGTKAGTFANVLSAIEKLNGSAESKLNTFSGAVTHAGNAFDDFRKEIGLAITQNPVFISAINKVSEILSTMSGVLSANSESIAILVGEGFLTLINGTKYVVQAFDFMISAIRVAFNTVEIVADAMIGSVLTLFAPFSDTVKEVIKGIVYSAHEAEKTISDVVQNGSFGKIVDSLDQIGDAAEDGLSKLESGMKIATPAIINTKSAISDLTEEQLRQRKEIDSNVESLAKQADSTKTNYELQIEQLNAFYGAKEVADTIADETNYSLKLERENQFYLDKQAARDQALNDELKTIQSSTVAEETKLKASIAAQNKYFSDSQKMALDNAQKEKKIKDEETRFKKEQDEKQVKARTDTLNVFATLSESSSKELATIGKAAAIAQLAYQTPLAIANAYTYGTGLGGPVLGATFGTLAAIAMADQAARIGAAKSPSVPKPDVKSENEMHIKKIDLDIARAEQAQGENPNADLESQIQSLKKERDALQKKEEIRRLEEEVSKYPRFATGGIVGGTSWSGDKVTARVNSGEAVLTRQQQTKLFEIVNGESRGGSVRVEQLLATLIDTIKNTNTSINIDGREIINVVRQGLNNGRTLT